MNKWIFLVIFIVVISIIGSINASNKLRVRKVEALEEIALNLGEVSMSLDNIVDLKEVIMMDLDERLPDWAWNKEIK